MINWNTRDNETILQLNANTSVRKLTTKPNPKASNFKVNNEKNGLKILPTMVKNSPLLGAYKTKLRKTKER